MYVHIVENKFLLSIVLAPGKFESNSVELDFGFFLHALSMSD